MRSFLLVLLLVVVFAPQRSFAQELAEIAEQLERAKLLAEALRDQLKEIQSGAELSGLERAAILLEGLTDELPDIKISGTRTPRSRKNDPGFRTLYTADRDGTNVQYLTAAPGMIGSASPAWSPSGSMIAFDAHPELGQYRLAHIFVHAVSGPFKGSVRHLGCGNVPTWSPDETQIAFMLNSGNPDGVEGGIWVMNSDGSDRRRLCDGWYPNWSPDGSSICVQSITDDPQCPRVFDIASGKTRRLLGDEWTVTYSGATWSPGGDRLIFIGVFKGQQHLATVDVSGAEETVQILYTEEDPQRKLHGPPAWSPDGKEVVIAIEDPGPRDRQWTDSFLYRISVVDPQEPQLFENSREGVINRGISWAPDGKRLVFSSER